MLMWQEEKGNLRCNPNCDDSDVKKLFYKNIKGCILETLNVDFLAKMLWWNS